MCMMHHRQAACVMAFLSAFYSESKWKKVCLDQHTCLAYICLSESDVPLGQNPEPTQRQPEQNTTKSCYERPAKFLTLSETLQMLLNFHQACSKRGGGGSSAGSTIIMCASKRTRSKLALTNIRSLPLTAKSSTFIHSSCW